MGEGVGLLYVRVVIFWICVRSAGYYIPPALLSVGGGCPPPWWWGWLDKLDKRNPLLRLGSAYCVTVWGAVTPDGAGVGCRGVFEVRGCSASG